MQKKRHFLNLYIYYFLIIITILLYYIYTTLRLFCFLVFFRRLFLSFVNLV